MRKMPRLLTAAAVLALVPLSVQAQDTSLEPNYETVDLSAGFPDDPYVVTLQSGGDIDASTLGDTCVGFIADAPDVRLNYEAGTLPLYISAISDADTTLVVNAPDGQWYCNDDGEEETDPLVWFDVPQSGQYDIWVGSFGEATMHEAALNISEVGAGSGDGVSLDVGGEPGYETVTLTAGFPNDPYTVALQSGGENDASPLGDTCAGYIATTPDVRLNYTAGEFPLYIRSISQADTTLAVNGPDGQWYCNDDGAGGLNPLVWFDAPQSGQYDIFVGTYADSELHPASLEISEIAAE